MIINKTAVIFSLIVASSCWPSSLAEDHPQEQGNFRGLKRQGKNKGKPVVEPSDSGSVEANLEGGKGPKLEAKRGEKGKGYDIMLTLEDGCKIQTWSSPETEEITIRSLGKKCSVSEGERESLRRLSGSLVEDKRTETDSVDAVGSQAARLAELMSNWPEGLDIDFTFDAEAEREYHKEKEKKRKAKAGRKDESEFPTPDPDDQEPMDDRYLRDLEEEPDVDEGGDEMPSSGVSRRLGYRSLCAWRNSWFRVTHDCLWYGNWHDKTSYWAYISRHACGSCSGERYFWTGSYWRCYTPNHSRSVEYSYGCCFGRCGGGCGNPFSVYTVDCADHDSCVSFGHSLTSMWCNDEFLRTVDDFLFGPICWWF